MREALLQPPTVSVVLPVFNGEHYIRESLDSILQQTGTDFEIVVSDNGSSDRTAAIVTGYRDARVRYVSGKNVGIFGNLNRAFSAARGRLVQLFSHDDVMLPGCLEVQTSILDDVPEAGMTYCRFSQIDGEGQPLPSRDDSRILRAVPSIIPPNESARYFLAFGCLPGSISPVMLTRAAYDRLGPFRSDLTYVGDFEYWVRLGRSYAIVVNPSILMYVRRHARQATRTITRRFELLGEEIPIWRDLLSTFPVEERPRMEEYVLHARGSQYMNWLIKALLRGDALAVRKAMRLLSPPFTLGRIAAAFVKSRNLSVEPSWESVVPERAPT